MDTRTDQAARIAIAETRQALAAGSSIEMALFARFDPRVKAAYEPLLAHGRLCAAPQPPMTPTVLLSLLTDRDQVLVCPQEDLPVRNGR